MFSELQLSDLLWPTLIGVAAFVGSLVLVGILVVMLPADYFKRRRKISESEHPVIRWGLRIVKNLAGALLVVAGVAMLVLPGQGVLTILIGVMLLDFPGKWRLQRKLISRPGVLKSINSLRKRFGRPPLALDGRQEDKKADNA